MKTLMPKPTLKDQTIRFSDPSDRTNPFLTDQAEKLWKAIRQQSTPISKEEILRQLAEQKKRTDD